MREIFATVQCFLENIIIVWFGILTELWYYSSLSVVCTSTVCSIIYFLTGANVTIMSSDYMVSENHSSVKVCVNLTDIPAGGLECEVVATINTTDGTKASMSFYMPQTQKVYLATKMQVVIQMSP